VVEVEKVARFGSMLEKTISPTLLNEVRINTTVGTRVDDAECYREQLREVTRIDEVGYTQDSLTFLKGDCRGRPDSIGMGTEMRKRVGIYL
jgi:hypothetical protein